MLQRAVVDAVQVRLRYAGRDRAETERIVHPLGLVAKASVWYLVAGTDAGLRTFRVSRVRSVSVTDEPADRPKASTSPRRGRTIVDRSTSDATGSEVEATAEPEAVPWFQGAFGPRARSAPPPTDGRIEVEIRSWSAHSLTSEVAPLGGSVEVFRPRSATSLLAWAPTSPTCTGSLSSWLGTSRCSEASTSVART